MVFPFLATLFVSFFFFTTVASRCYNATKLIENGRIECRFPMGTPFSPSYQYGCVVLCNAGYNPYPRRSTFCARSRHGRERNYYGTWHPPIEDLACVVSTQCTVIDGVYNPEHGSVRCDRNVMDSRTKHVCNRRCDLPYVPTDPEHMSEHCSPSTKFIWSHALRHNSSRMPPCELRSECVDVEKTTTPTHGRFVCQDEKWASTKTCDLVCDRGYMPTSSTRQIFCGPTTGFRWSHEWSALKDGGCQRTPVLVEVTVSKPCNESTQRADVGSVTGLFDAANKNFQGEEMWKLVNWRRECFSSENQVKYYFNFNDLCIDGTCEDACNALKMQDVTESEQCLTMCHKDFIGDREILHQMREITLNHIAKTLMSTEPDVAIQFGPEGFKSLEVEVGVSEYKGDWVFAPDSPFCFNAN